MSTRAHLVSLASLEPIRGAVASRDRPLVEAVVALRAERLRELYGPGEEIGGAVRRFRSFARSMIMCRSAPEAEPGCWNYVIELLADHFKLRPNRDLPLGGGWKHYLAWELYRGVADGHVSATARRSLGYLEDGRPLRGTRVEHDGCVFGWLGPDEARELAKSLSGLDRAALAGADMLNFHDALVESLKIIGRRNRVLFLAAS